MRCSVVIGANYGDEGKGAFTAYLCRNASLICGAKCVNVLNNGGCQRGHTVVDPVYGRRVFHHFGSGTLNGAVTYMAEDFLVNPMQFAKERAELHALLGSPYPKVYISEKCRLQLPIDICLNRRIETARGAGRHGSVGCGIWETILRSRIPEYSMTVGRFIDMDRDSKFSFIKSCFDIYGSSRCAEEDVAFTEEDRQIFNSDGFILHYLRDFDEILRTSEIDASDGHFIATNFDHIVIENGQGLLIGEEAAGDSVNSTPSRTGAQSFNPGGCVDEFYAYYVSRTYLTRHGAGELPGETGTEGLPGIPLKDKTNVENEWQGAIRYAPLDYQALRKRTDEDFLKAVMKCPSGTTAVKHMVFTHLNEVEIPDEHCWMASYVSDTDDSNFRKASSLVVD